MNILNLEDSLEEFDALYMESYNQAINGIGLRSSSFNGTYALRNSTTKSRQDILESRHDKKGCNSTFAYSEPMSLSSPLLGNQNLATFPTLDNSQEVHAIESKSNNNVHLLSNYSPKSSAHISMEPSIAKFNNFEAKKNSVRKRPARRKSFPIGSIRNSSIEKSIVKQRVKPLISRTALAKLPTHKANESMNSYTTHNLQGSDIMYISKMNKENSEDESDS